MSKESSSLQGWLRAERSVKEEDSRRGEGRLASRPGYCASVGLNSTLTQQHDGE